MGVVKPDQAKLKREQEALNKKQRIDAERVKYLQVLKESKKFQKYVVEEIFEKSLNETFTLDKLPISDEMGKLGAVALQYILARKSVQTIISKLKN